MLVFQLNVYLDWYVTLWIIVLLLKALCRLATYITLDLIIPYRFHFMLKTMGKYNDQVCATKFSKNTSHKYGTA